MYDALKGVVGRAAFAVGGKAAVSEGLHSLVFCPNRRPFPDARAESPGVSLGLNVLLLSARTLSTRYAIRAAHTARSGQRRRDFICSARSIC